MKSDTLKVIAKTAVLLFLICAFSAGILAYVNAVTAPIIVQNNKKLEDKARAEALPAKKFEPAETEDGRVYHKGINDKTVGYVFITSAPGYGGDVEIMTGVDIQGRITGIKILSINETPGLGMNAKKPSFVNQFSGKSGELSVVKNKKAEDDEILAITSATITSKAVASAVNKALSLYEEVKEE